MAMARELRDAAVHLISVGHVNVYKYPLSFFFQACETLNRLEKERFKAQVYAVAMAAGFLLPGSHDDVKKQLEQF